MGLWEPRQFSLPPPFDMMKKGTHQHRMETKDWLYYKLCENQKYRDQRVDWDRYEMQTLLDDVNWARAKMDKDPVPMRELLKKQQLASGHVDYSPKMGLYAMELVYDVP